MSILETHFRPPAQVADGQSDPVREIVVVYTTPAATQAALRRAAVLCEGLFNRIRLVAVTVVPYPLAVSTPPVATEFTEEILAKLVSVVSADVRIDMVNCRDEVDALCRALQPRSLVLIGPRAHWWSRHESRLTNVLTRHGHAVLLLDEKLEGK